MSITEQVSSMTDASKSVGARLAEARAAEGLSIDDVCRRTNIRPAVVSALENGDIAPSGGAVYARGHVRSLARAVGLDPAPLLEEFDASYGTASPPALVLVPDSDAAEVSLRPSAPRTSGPRWPLAMAAVLVVVIVIALVQLLLPGSKNAADRSVKPPPSASKAVKPKPKPKPSSLLVFPVPAQGVTLRFLLTSRPSWLDVSDEQGAELIQRVVDPAPLPFDFHAAGQLRATIGDAGATAVSCNGHPLGVLGGSGAVVTLTFTRGDPQCPAS
jgi:transcriptional regulator with XRE-family HTH domain